MASFTKEVNPRLAKCPLKTNGRLAKRGLASLVKEATAGRVMNKFGFCTQYMGPTINPSNVGEEFWVN